MGGGWVSLEVGIMEGMYCIEHWVWCINNEFWNTEKKFKKNINNAASEAQRFKGIKPFLIGS